jgi:hypothetical protein
MITENNKTWANYQSYGVPDISDYSETMDVYVHWSGWTSNSGNYITQPIDLKGLMKLTTGTDLDTFGCIRKQYTFGTIEIKTTDVNPNINYFYSIWIPFSTLGGSFTNMLINAGTTPCGTEYFEDALPDSIASRNVSITSGGSIPPGDYRVLWIPNLRLPNTETLTNNIYIKGETNIITPTSTPTPTSTSTPTPTSTSTPTFSSPNCTCWSFENTGIGVANVSYIDCNTGLSSVNIDFGATIYKCVTYGETPILNSGTVDISPLSTPCDNQGDCEPIPTPTPT